MQLVVHLIATCLSSNRWEKYKGVTLWLMGVRLGPSGQRLGGGLCR